MSALIVARVQADARLVEHVKARRRARCRAGSRGECAALRRPRASGPARSSVRYSSPTLSRNASRLRISRSGPSAIAAVRAAELDVRNQAAASRTDSASTSAMPLPPTRTARLSRREAACHRNASQRELAQVLAVLLAHALRARLLVAAHERRDHAVERHAPGCRGSRCPPGPTSLDLLALEAVQHLIAELLREFAERHVEVDARRLRHRLDDAIRPAFAAFDGRAPTARSRPCGSRATDPARRARDRSRCACRGRCTRRTCPAAS